MRAPCHLRGERQQRVRSPWPFCFFPNRLVRHCDAHSECGRPGPLRDVAAETSVSWCGRQSLPPEMSLSGAMVPLSRKPLWIGGGIVLVLAVGLTAVYSTQARSYLP